MPMELRDPTTGASFQSIDIGGARAAGYSDAEIADHLKGSGHRFDIDGARQAGYNDTEIIDWLQQPAEPARLAQRPRRNLFAMTNDAVIEAGNIAASGVKALGNFVAPGNGFSRAIGGFIERGERSQSDNTRQHKQELADNLEKAGGFTEEAGAFLDYAIENPDLVAAQAFGALALPVGAVRGGASVARGLGFGAKGVVAGGTVGGAAAGSAMAGGDAAGNAYDLVMETPDEVLMQSPKWAEMERAILNERRQVAREDVRAELKALGLSPKLPTIPSHVRRP